MACVERTLAYTLSNYMIYLPVFSLVMLGSEVLHELACHSVIQSLILNILMLNLFMVDAFLIIHSVNQSITGVTSITVWQYNFIIITITITITITDFTVNVAFSIASLPCTVCPCFCKQLFNQKMGKNNILRLDEKEN